MKKDFRFHEGVLLSVFLVIVIGIVILHKKMNVAEVSPLFFWVTSLGSVMAFFCLYCFNIKIDDDKIVAYYNVVKPISIYSCFFKDIRMIDYTRGGFMFGCIGRKRTILLATGIKGYKEIIRFILEKNSTILINPAARKKLG